MGKTGHEVAGRWVDWAVLGLYVALSLVMTYPLIVHVDTLFAGRHLDARVFQWNNWWIKQAISERLDPNDSRYIYYPSGASLSTHNLNWISSLLSVPLDVLWGPVVAYNLTFLLTFFFSGFGMYLLVHHLVQRRKAAWAAGLIFAFFPYHVSGNWDGQMNLANIQWLPLCVLFVLRTVERKRIGDALLAGLFMGLAGLDCRFFPLFIALWGGVFVIYSLVCERKQWNWRLVGLLALAAAVAGLLMMLSLWPMIADSTPEQVVSALEYYTGEKSTDLLAFVTPDSAHPLWGHLVAPAYARFKHWRPAFLGFAALAAAAYALLRVCRRSALWFLTGLMFVLLALGARLQINGNEYAQVPMPYNWLITLFPFFKVIRQASRFNVMVALSLAVLVGLAWADLLGRLGRRLPGRSSIWGGWMATALFSGWILFEYLAVPCPSLPSQVSPFYQALAQEREDFAILELPLDDFYSRRSLYAQTVHHKRLVNGYLARVAADAHAFVNSNALLRALYIQMEVDPALHDIPAEIGVLAANNIRYVVLQKLPLPNHPAVDADVLASWRTLFGPSVFYEDEEIVVYQTRLLPEQAGLPLASFDGALGLVQVKAKRTRVFDAHSLTVDLLWKALEQPDQRYRCELSLYDLEGERVAAVADVISPHYPTSDWPKGVVIAERYALPLSSALPGGDYTLSISVTQAGGQAQEDMDTVQVPLRIEREAVLLASALQDVQLPVQVTFGGKLRLVGCSSRQDARQLVLHLYWQALQAMDANYKIFVHLIRPADGAIVAQHDWMPRDWSYPTSLWDRQEILVDRIGMDVTGVEPGQYRLAVGVYLPGGDRLDAVTAGGQTVPDNRVVLGQPVQIEAQ